MRFHHLLVITTAPCMLCKLISYRELNAGMDTQC